jgi:hypothetical protein
VSVNGHASQVEAAAVEKPGVNEAPHRDQLIGPPG